MSTEKSFFLRFNRPEDDSILNHLCYEVAGSCCFKEWRSYPSGFLRFDRVCQVSEEVVFLEFTASQSNQILPCRRFMLWDCLDGLREPIQASPVPQPYSFGSMHGYEDALPEETAPPIEDGSDQNQLVDIDVATAIFSSITSGIPLAEAARHHRTVKAVVIKHLMHASTGTLPVSIITRAVSDVLARRARGETDLEILHRKPEYTQEFLSFTLRIPPGAVKAAKSAPDLPALRARFVSAGRNAIYQMKLNIAKGNHEKAARLVHEFHQKSIKSLGKVSSPKASAERQSKIDEWNSQRKTHRDQHMARVNARARRKKSQRKLSADERAKRVYRDWLESRVENLESKLQKFLISVEAFQRLGGNRDRFIRSLARKKINRDDAIQMYPRAQQFESAVQAVADGVTMKEVRKRFRLPADIVELIYYRCCRKQCPSIVAEVDSSVSVEQNLLAIKRSQRFNQIEKSCIVGMTVSQYQERVAKIRSRLPAAVG
ncbi:MAG: hypothetical protein AAF802_01750 [Planctomycetota bacterium]